MQNVETTRDEKKLKISQHINQTKEQIKIYMYVYYIKRMIISILKQLTVFLSSADPNSNHQTDGYLSISMDNNISPQVSVRLWRLPEEGLPEDSWLTKPSVMQMAGPECRNTTCRTEKNPHK